MKITITLLPAILLASICAYAQGEDDWPSLGYLRNDYKAVSVVAHVYVEKAVVVGRVGGYENWKVSCRVVEPLKGGLKKGAQLEYYHGAEAGFREGQFAGNKIVFLLTEYDKEKKTRVYSVLENSTLGHTEDRMRKLRVIKYSFRRRRHK